MTHIIILICSIYIPPDHCSRDNAVDVIYRDVPFGNMGIAAQTEAIQAGIQTDIYHYEKIAMRR